MKERLGQGVSHLKMVRTPIIFKFPFPPEKVVEYFREFFGPTKMAFAALNADGQAALRSDLVDLWTRDNRATDGMTEVEAEYLEVNATRA